MKLAGDFYTHTHTHTWKNCYRYLFLDSLVVIRIHFLFYFFSLQARKCVYWFSLIAFAIVPENCFFVLLTEFPKILNCFTPILHNTAHAKKCNMKEVRHNQKTLGIIIQFEY